MVAGLVVTIAGAATQAAAQPGFGAFQGKVVAEWLDHEGDNRRMRLLEPFAYRDGAGKLWNVPKGWKVDGASIPPQLWSWVGSPFTGPYRRASVIHDYHCDVRTESWRSVHRMFYDAMRADGVSESQAKLMYRAVYEFGPRWMRLAGTGLNQGEIVSTPFVPKFIAHDPKALDAWIESTSPTLAEIEREVDKLETAGAPP